jgi:hypothetical protein
MRPLGYLGLGFFHSQFQRPKVLAGSNLYVSCLPIGNDGFRDLGTTCYTSWACQINDSI